MHTESNGPMTAQRWEQGGLYHLPGTRRWDCFVTRLFYLFEMVKVICNWVGASKVVLTGFDKRFYVKLDRAKIEDGSSIRAILLRHCDDREGPPEYIEVGFVTSRGSSQFGEIFNQDSPFVADDCGANFNL